jgi:hypothetical protein
MLGQPSRDLQVTARIGGGDYARAGRCDVADFTIEEQTSLLGLRERVDTRRAAAPRRLGQFHQRDTGQQSEQRARLPRDLLAMNQVARLVIGHRGRALGRSLRRPPAANLIQPFVHIAQLRVPRRRQIAIAGIVRQQSTVVTKMRSASTGVRDDCVIPVWRDEIDQLPRQALRGLQLAVMGVERAAACLAPGCVDGAPVGEQHVRRVAVDVGKHQILDAAGEESDAVAR